MRCDNDVSEVGQLHNWISTVQLMRYYNDIKGGIKIRFLCRVELCVIYFGILTFIHLKVFEQVSLGV